MRGHFLPRGQYTPECHKGAGGQQRLARATCGAVDEREGPPAMHDAGRITQMLARFTLEHDGAIADLAVALR
jgi:hypothetical protein